MKLEVLVFRFPSLFPVFCYFLRKRATCNIEARSCNHCCCGNIIGITYYECVSVALGIQHAVYLRHIVICVYSGSTIGFLFWHKRHQSRNYVMEYKMRVLIFSTTFFENVSHSKKNWERYGKKSMLVLMHSARNFCQILMELWFSRRGIEK
jgi:hypothetical protein